jgi:hypothetical protein
MSMAFKIDDNREYATKTEIRLMLGVSYGKISDAIKIGKLVVHLIDGKIQLNVAEAKAVLSQRLTIKHHIDESFAARQEKADLFS